MEWEIKGDFHHQTQFLSWRSLQATRSEVLRDGSLEELPNSTGAVKRELSSLVLTVSLRENVGMHFKSNMKIHRVRGTDGINHSAGFWGYQTFLTDTDIAAPYMSGVIPVLTQIT